MAASSNQLLAPDTPPGAANYANHFTELLQRFKASVATDTALYTACLLPLNLPRLI